LSVWRSGGPQSYLLRDDDGVCCKNDCVWYCHPSTPLRMTKRVRMSLFDSLPCRQAGAQSDTGSNQQPDSQNLSTSELLNFVKLSNLEPPNLELFSTFPDSPDNYRDTRLCSTEKVRFAPSRLSGSSNFQTLNLQTLYNQHPAPSNQHPRPYLPVHSGRQQPVKPAPPLTPFLRVFC